MAVLQNRSKFDCNNCTWGRHCDASNPAPIKKWVIPDYFESDICFLPMITDRSLFFIRLANHYRRGILFDSGGLMRQPNAYLEAMDLIEREQNE